MYIEELKKRVLQFKWEFWADRPFGAFMLSIFKYGNTRKYHQQVGVNAEWPAMLFQRGAFYRTDEVWDIYARELEVYLRKGGTVFGVVRSCEKYGNGAREQVKALLKSSEQPLPKLRTLSQVLSTIYSYVWLAHGFEHLYLKELHRNVPKYMAGDVEKNIGDISFPKKKNAHVYFEKALRNAMPIEEVQEKFAWIKARDGFSDGFTVDELASERNRLRKSESKEDFKHPLIPAELRELSEIVQELVYFRTLRTDFLYELLYLSRPILTDVANIYDLKFLELRDYSIYDLISGKLEYFKYRTISAISFGENFALLHGDVFVDQGDMPDQEVKGVVAFKGLVRGVARIVMTAQEIGKIQFGDILIAPTTAPSYIIGMQRAAAFVTDEGGITSHAAIVARELKIPCIIGTKIATKVLKDGDMVEVDAERGIVKIVKRA